VGSKGCKTGRVSKDRSRGASRGGELDSGKGEIKGVKRLLSGMSGGWGHGYLKKKRAFSKQGEQLKCRSVGIMV